MSYTNFMSAPQLAAGQANAYLTYNDGIGVFDAAGGGLTINVSARASATASVVLSFASTPEEWHHGVVQFVSANATTIVVFPNKWRHYRLWNKSGQLLKCTTPAKNPAYLRLPTGTVKELITSPTDFGSPQAGMESTASTASGALVMTSSVFSVNNGRLRVDTSTVGVGASTTASTALTVQGRKSGDQTLLELRTSGAPRFMLNNTAGDAWVYSIPAAGFRVSRVGSPITEFELSPSGALTIGECFVVRTNASTRPSYPWPRVTTTQRNAMTASHGATVFNTTSGVLNVYSSDGGGSDAWRNVAWV